MSINSCFFIGVISRDAEIKMTPNGKAVARFSIGVPESKKNADGTWEKTWNNLSCDYWSDTSEKLDALKKGLPVFISAKVKTERWKDKEGKEKTMLRFLVVELQPLQKHQAPSVPAPPSARDSFSSDPGGFDADFAF